MGRRIRSESQAIQTDPSTNRVGHRVRESSVDFPANFVARRSRDSVAAGTSLFSFWIMVGGNQRTVCETSRDVGIVPHDRLINVDDPFNRIMLNTFLRSW